MPAPATPARHAREPAVPALGGRRGGRAGAGGRRRAGVRRHRDLPHTLDSITCVRGEIFLITDVEEIKMTPGDTVTIRGTNHGWSNRSDQPALLVGSMIDAVPPA